MDFIDQPPYNYSMPMSPGGFQAPNFSGNQQPQQVYRPVRQPEPVNMPVFTGGEQHLFTVVDEGKNVDNSYNARKMAVPVDNSSDAEIEEKKKRRGRPKKKASEETKDENYLAPIFRDRADTSAAPEKLSGEVESTPTAYTYRETEGMLRETIGQIDALNGELMSEFNTIKNSRTMKNKYNVLVGISENVGSLIGNRISAIKEINNSITKSNDLDYKKLKDIRASQADQNDDAYVANLYQAFLQNPQGAPNIPQIPQVDETVYGSGIVRATLNAAQVEQGVPIADAGYMGYMANLTPEQNLMRYERDPNVKQVVVYDASTGNKYFQYMNMATGEAIANVPTYGEDIMQDTTLDLANGIAKNINLHEEFPIITINDQVTSQY